MVPPVFEWKPCEPILSALLSFQKNLYSDWLPGFPLLLLIWRIQVHHPPKDSLHELSCCFFWPLSHTPLIYTNFYAA